MDSQNQAFVHRKTLQTLSLVTFFIPIVFVIIVILVHQAVGFILYVGLIDIIIGFVALVYAIIHRKDVSGWLTLLALAVVLIMAWFCGGVIYALSAWKG